MPAQLTTIIRLIRIIWVNSPFYNTRERLTGLFRKLSNEIIRLCSQAWSKFNNFQVQNFQLQNKFKQGTKFNRYRRGLFSTFFRRVRATRMNQRRVENTRVHFWTLSPVSVKALYELLYFFAWFQSWPHKSQFHSRRFSTEKWKVLYKI